MTSPRIYVGTYSKYNSGSIEGAWLDLEDYSDKDEFHAACLELHSDESDPELMFQDFEGIPAGMVSESHIDAEVWEWMELDEDEREMVRVYREHEDASASIEYIRGAFQGKADSKAAFAEQFADDMGAVPSDVKWPLTCIDWDAAARELEYDGYSFIREGGELWVFFAH